MSDPRKFWISLLVLLFLAFFLLYRLREILWPFFFAFLFAYQLDPVIAKMIRYGVRRTVAVWGVFILFSLAIIGVGFFLFSAIRHEIVVVQARIPDYINTFQNTIMPDLEEKFHFRLPMSTEEYLRDFTERLLTLSPGVAQSLSNLVVQAFSRTFSFLGFLIDLLLIPVATLYFLFDFDKIREKLIHLVPAIYRDDFVGHLVRIDRILSGFIVGQMLISLILSILYTAGLTWIGVDLSVVLGILSGFLNIIPYIGVLAGGILSTLFALLKFHDTLHPLFTLLLFGSGHLLDGYILGPRWVGQKIGLHPLGVIFALLVGGSFFGLFGLVAAVPIAATLTYLAKSGIEIYQRSRFYNGPPDTN